MRVQSPEPLQDRQRSADGDRLRRQGPVADENNVKEYKSRRKCDPQTDALTQEWRETLTLQSDVAEK